MFIIALNEEECLLIITANLVHVFFPGTLNNMHIHVLVWNVSFRLKPTVYCFAMHFGEVLLVWNFHSLGFWVGCISTHYLNLRVRLLTDVNIQRWSSSLSGKQQVYFSASMVTKQGWEIMIHPSFTKQNVGMQPPVSSFLSIYFLLDLLRVYTCEPLIWIALVHIFTQRDNNKESDSIIHPSFRTQMVAASHLFVHIHLLSPRSLASLYLQANNWVSIWIIFVHMFTHRLCGPLQHFFGKITSSKIICTHQLLRSLVNSLICDSHVNWMWQVPIECKGKYKYIPSLTQAS